MKNKKTKYYIKNNLIGLIVGGIIFGSLGVYAAITFPSNEVSFDPSNSTLLSTNVKAAIDELYKKCTNPSTGEKIIKDNGLEKDQYECRYFFTGANPNNYITFNNETAGWRIISVECDGTIKLINVSSISNYWWHRSSSNNWALPVTLNTYLNNNYYNTLNSISQAQIVTHNFGIGAVTDNNNDLENQVNAENGTTWNGKIAIPTVSEYLRTNSNENCKTFRSYSVNYDTCKNTTWMFSSNDWWTLSAYNNNSDRVFWVMNIGDINYSSSIESRIGVRPTLYLSQDIKITGGTGTESDPYEISL